MDLEETCECYECGKDISGINLFVALRDGCNRPLCEKCLRGDNDD